MTMLTVKVKPRSHRAAVLPQADGPWEVRLRSPPVDGKANAELIELLAEHFGVAKSAVTIRSGGSGRTKVVVISP